MSISRVAKIVPRSCKKPNRNNKKGFLFSVKITLPCGLTSFKIVNIVTYYNCAITKGGGLSTVPYNDRIEFFCHFVFQGPDTIKAVYTKEITREGTYFLSLGLALRLYPLL